MPTPRQIRDSNNYAGDGYEHDERAQIARERLDDLERAAGVAVDAALDAIIRDRIKARVMYRMRSAVASAIAAELREAL